MLASLNGLASTVQQLLELGAKAALADKVSEGEGRALVYLAGVATLCASSSPRHLLVCVCVCVWWGVWVSGYLHVCVWE